jgi:FKBP-type peptidyl-prolyl cis-trans isomerase
MKKEYMAERGLTTPVFIGLAAAGIAVIGLLFFLLQQGTFENSSQAEEPVIEQQEQNMEEPEIDTTELIIEDVQEGDGQAVVPGDVVRVHYAGTLEDGTEFDRSRKQEDSPFFEFQVGVGQVIQGWDIGLEGMRIGGTRKLTIPGHLAYGEAGVPGLIPPNAALIFEIELFEIIDMKG